MENPYINTPIGWLVQILLHGVAYAQTHLTYKGCVRDSLAHIRPTPSSRILPHVLYSLTERISSGSSGRDSEMN